MHSYSNHRLDAANFVHFLAWMQHFVMLLPLASLITLGKSIMLCINSNMSQEQQFILGYKCRDFLNKIRRLIAKEIVHMPNVKTLIMSFIFSSTFLVRHLFDDCSVGTTKLLKGEQLRRIHDGFYELSSPNVHNLVVSFKHCLGGGYIDNILELKSKSCYDKNVASLNKF
jgi:hypothetical protein